MWSAPEPPEYNQWALNPSAYQDLSHEEIDWALLAQQWIKMKGNYPKDQVPPAPPPPTFPRKDEAPVERIENEGGEAPMDMETREESLGEDVPQWGPYNNWNQWDNWNQWNAGGRVGPPPQGAPPVNFDADLHSGFNEGPVPGTIDYNHGNVELFPQDEKVNQIAVRPGIPNHSRPGAKHPDGLHHYPPGHPGQHGGPGYWSGSGPPGDGPHLGPYTKHNRNLWKHGMARPPRDRFGREDKPKEEVEEEDTVEVLDAAKRRHLPAWIRDGLEKMEREKQKKLDRERQLKEREQRLEQQRLEDEHEAASIAAGGMPRKSKFESDSESESENKGAASIETRKSRFHSSDSPGSSPVRSFRGRSPSVEKGPPKSREEIMQEVMMKVRQMLTLILLEVTNEEMRNIAEETYSKARMKAPATDLQKTPALASLTGKLGLGIYEDSDEESGTDGEVDAAKQTNGADSDEDLRETIRRRKQDFINIEREIEADLAEDEERERRLKGRDEEDDDDDDDADGEEPDEDGRNEEKNGRGGGNKNQVQVEHQKAGSSLHMKEHGLQEPAGGADLAASKDGGAPNNHSASRRSGSRSRSPNREGSRRGSSTDGRRSSSSRSSSSRVSSRRKRSKRSGDSRKKDRKGKDKKRRRSGSREEDKKSKSRRDSEDSSRRGKSRSKSRSRSRSRSDSGTRRDRKHRDSSRESSRVGSRFDRSGHRDSYRDRGRDRYRDYRERDRDRESRRRRGGSRSRRSSSRGRSTSRSRRSDSRSRRSSSRTRTHRRSRSRSKRSRSVESRRRRDSSGSRSVSPSKNRRRRSRSRSRSRSYRKSSRRRHSSESSSERPSGKKSRHRRRD